MDQHPWQNHAERMARKMEVYLLDPAKPLTPAEAIPQAVNLAGDYVRYLHQPERTVSFVCAFHRTAERWSAWAAWFTALDLGLEASATHGTPAERIFLLNARGQAARELNQYEHARELGRQALQLAEQHGDPKLITPTHNKLGLLALRQNQLALAQEHFTLAYRIGVGHVLPLELGHYTINLGAVAVQQEDYIAAAQFFNQALTYYTEADAELAVAKVQCNLADLQRRQGTLREIPAALLQARELFQEREVWHNYGLAENDVGYIHYRLREWPEAEQAFLRALSTFERIGGLAMKATVMTNLVTLYVDWQSWARAEEYIQQGHQLAGLSGQPLVQARFRVDQGRMFLAQGRLADARAAWVEALAVQQAAHAEAEAATTQRWLDALDSGDISSIQEEWLRLS